MRRSRALFASAVLLSFCAVSKHANADTIVLAPGTMPNSEAFTAGNGAGQGVVVSATTVIDGFAFFLREPRGGEVTYMIWDSTDTNLLYSDTFALAANSKKATVESDPLSFTLLAGQEYYFAVIGNTSLDVGEYTGPYSGTGLAADTSAGGQTSYTNFASPTPSAAGTQELGVTLYTATPTPEPASLVFVGTAMAAALGAGRRKFLR